MFTQDVCFLSSGTLQLTRRLGDIVRKEDLVDSEYLTTLLVLVARCVTTVGQVPSYRSHVSVCVHFSFLFFFLTKLFVCIGSPPQGELPAVGEELRVSVGTCCSAIQQVS